MKKFILTTTHKRNGKEVIIEQIDGKYFKKDAKGNDVEIKEATMKRWYEVVAEVEVKEEKKEERKEENKELVNNRVAARQSKKRDDKFRPKLGEPEVREIRKKFAEGAKKSHLAKEYGVSFRTITCIVEYIMWKHVS